MHNFERGGARAEHESLPADALDVHTPAPLTPSQLLRMKSDHLQSISILAEQFGARMVDVSEHSVIVELSGKTSKVEAFLSLLKPFGLLESARTGKTNLLRIIGCTLSCQLGLMAMPRTPFKWSDDGEVATDAGSAVDASLLPPG